MKAIKHLNFESGRWQLQRIATFMLAAFSFRSCRMLFTSLLSCKYSPYSSAISLGLAWLFLFMQFWLTSAKLSLQLKRVTRLLDDLPCTKGLSKTSTCQGGVDNLPDEAEVNSCPEAGCRESLFCCGRLSSCGCCSYTSQALAAKRWNQVSELPVDRRSGGNLGRLQQQAFGTR